MKVNAEWCEMRAKKIWHLSMAHVVEIPIKQGGVGVHYSWWNKLRRGEFNLTEEKARLLAKALKCNVEDIYLKEEPEEKPGYKVTGSVITIDETLWNMLNAMDQKLTMIANKLNGEQTS